MYVVFVDGVWVSIFFVDLDVIEYVFCFFHKFVFVDCLKDFFVRSPDFLVAILVGLFCESVLTSGDGFPYVSVLDAKLYVLEDVSTC